MATRRRTESWGLQLRAWAPGDLWRVRRDYAALRDQHNNDPRDTSSSDEASNLAANNPLMASQDSPWAAGRGVRHTLPHSHSPTRVLLPIRSRRDIPPRDFTIVQVHRVSHSRSTYLKRRFTLSEVYARIDVVYAVTQTMAVSDDGKKKKV